MLCAEKYATKGIALNCIDWKSTLAAALAALYASHSFAQARAVGNAAEVLPPVASPRSAQNVTVHVESAAPPTVHDLLAHKITPLAFKVEGVKSVPFAQVAAQFEPFVGKNITVGQLIEAANSVTRLYKDRGYALSFCFVPPQSFEKGIVRVTVVEGYVATVKITGNPGRSERHIREIAAHIVNDRPLRREVFERYVNVLGLLPDTRVSASVAPPQMTDGATELVLDVKQKHVNFASGIAANQPGIQALLSVTESGLTPFDERLAVSALVPPGRNHQSYYAASGSVPIGSDGLSARADLSRYRAEPANNPGLPSFVHRDIAQDKAGISATYPLQLSNERSITMTVNGYGTANLDRFRNIYTGAMIEQKSAIRALQLQLDYASNHNNQVRKASLNLAKAFNVLGAYRAGDSNIPGTIVTNPVSLTFMRSGASFMQANDWPSGIGTSVSLTGQYSASTLPTSERVSFGAQRFALGYEPGEAAGDSGWGVTAELNYPLRLQAAYLKAVVPYIAWDTAKVFLHNSPPQARLSSVAAGIRLTDRRLYSLDMSLAKAVGAAPIESPSRAPRLNLNFSYQFD
ncbi:ShlB/FhaC/HecB family hemolysin secretion/activation protein [Burkholderia pyrrocinia]|uniref:POTRA domain-containing protein n=1 Tax=Burkholderia pyrrocinia TaxID=60550 RepID=A0ABZ3BN09_BURPY